MRQDLGTLIDLEGNKFSAEARRSPVGFLSLEQSETTQAWAVVLDTLAEPITGSFTLRIEVEEDIYGSLRSESI